jgi:hypothetical protein
MKNLTQILEAIETGQLAPDVAKKAARVQKSIQTHLKSWLTHGEKVQVTALGSHKVSFRIDFKYWMRSSTIDDVDEEFKYAITKSVDADHVFSIEIGASTGPEFVEAMLSGIRPGMLLHAEAFFPEIEYIVTWKQIVSRKG